MSSGKRHAPVAATVGAGVGGLVVGLLAGLATALFFVKRRQRKKAEEQFMPLESLRPCLTTHNTGQFRLPRFLYNWTLAIPGPHYSTLQ